MKPDYGYNWDNDVGKDWDKEPDFNLMWERIKRVTNGEYYLIACPKRGPRYLNSSECFHERLNDHGDACLDCGAIYFKEKGWG